MKSNILFIALSALIFFGCSSKDEEKKSPKFLIHEVYQTERNEADNIDSPAFWQGPNGENWVIATAKEGNKLVITDAEKGSLIKTFGNTGSGKGEFSRPNGILVIDSLLLIVERDNQRVQVLTLPELKTLGFICDSLIKPYGLTCFKISDKKYNLYITDNYEAAEDSIPPPEELNKRIHHYELSVFNDSVEAKTIKKFGAVSGSGILNIVESIYADPVHNHLLLSEEDMTQSSVKVYDLDGNFTGKVFGKGIFKFQVEGIALYECGDSNGYWIITDQDYHNNTFHIFTRKDFEYKGSFYGSKTTNTDGVWLTQVSFGKFKEGAFFAVHDDGNVSAFDLAVIADSLKLKEDCK